MSDSIALDQGEDLIGEVGLDHGKRHPGSHHQLMVAVKLISLAAAVFLATAVVASATPGDPPTTTQVQTRLTGILASQQETLATWDTLRNRQREVLRLFRVLVIEQFDTLSYAATSGAERARIAAAREAILVRHKVVRTETEQNADWAYGEWVAEAAHTTSFLAKFQARTVPTATETNAWVANTLALQTARVSTWDAMRDRQHEIVRLFRVLINEQFAVLRYATTSAAEKARVAAAREALLVGHKALHVEAEQDASWVYQEWVSEVVHTTSFLAKFEGWRAKWLVAQ